MNTNINFNTKSKILEPYKNQFEINAPLTSNVTQYGSHMIMNNIFKNSKEKYINIDTQFADEYGYDKNTYNNTSSFNFTFPEKICNVKSLKVENIEIPVSFYNISAALGNNYFKIVKSNGTFSMCVLSDGNYNISDLKNKIVYTDGNSQILLNVNDNNYSTLNYNTTSNDNNTYTIHFDTDASGNFDKHNFRTKLGWLLGFRTQSIIVNRNITPISDSIINLNTVRYLYLVLDEFSNGFTNSFVSLKGTHIMNKKILARIGVENTIYPFGNVIISSKSNGFLLSDLRCYNGLIDIQKINVQLVNEYGININLNGLDFSFLLKVTYE
jgi:hypothetical protein